MTLTDKDRDMLKEARIDVADIESYVLPKSAWFTEAEASRIMEDIKEDVITVGDYFRIEREIMELRAQLEILNNVISVWVKWHNRVRLGMFCLAGINVILLASLAAALM
jgi:hypothetical protein